VITARLATMEEKRRLVAGLMSVSAPFPPPGPERCVEVTVVAQPQVRPWRYPPSFDLQYGEWLRKRFERGDSAALQATVNADLTTLTGSIDRKDRAAEWVRERLPSHHQHIMEQARRTI
jgi:streptomycin 3"-adenylyltransferase